MSRSKLILVAEDDRIFRHLLEFTIRRAGYDVIAAADGDQAWTHILSGGVDLLVTDQQMPHCTGTELLQRIADHKGMQSGECLDANSMVASILCTAKGFEMDRQEIRQRFGLLDVMSKPFSPSKLVYVIDQYFASDISTMDDASRTEPHRISVPKHLARWGQWNSCPTTNTLR